MKWKMDLILFDTTYTVTVKKDANITTATASAASGAKGTEITLTITPATGYEVAEYEVIEGGVTVNPTTKKFTIGENLKGVRILFQPETSVDKGSHKRLRPMLQNIQFQNSADLANAKEIEERGKQEEPQP